MCYHTEAKFKIKLTFFLEKKGQPSNAMCMWSCNKKGDFLVLWDMFCHDVNHQNMKKIRNLTYHGYLSCTFYEKKHIAYGSWHELRPKKSFWLILKNYIVTFRTSRQSSWSKIPDDTWSDKLCIKLILPANLFSFLTVQFQKNI